MCALSISRANLRNARKNLIIDARQCHFSTLATKANAKGQEKHKNNRKVHPVSKKIHLLRARHALYCIRKKMPLLCRTRGER